MDKSKALQQNKKCKRSYCNIPSAPDSITNGQCYRCYELVKFIEERDGCKCDYNENNSLSIKRIPGPSYYSMEDDGNDYKYTM